ncbi:MAG TPA: hypothetical protein VGO47_12340 [Chlamydiales bacterium]|nr:hypothetical protein [Chlamydiales bacterium]
MFYAYQIFRSPASFSLTSIALTEQSMRSLTLSLHSLLSSGRSFFGLVQQIEDMYNIHHYSDKNLIVDGNLMYPRDGANALCPGMSLQFK